MKFSQDDLIEHDLNGISLPFHFVYGSKIQFFWHQDNSDRVLKMITSKTGKHRYSLS